MSVSDIINIVLIVLTVVSGFLSLYFKGNSTLYAKAADYIALAESTYTDAKSGGLKMQYVVSRLYALIPAAVRPFIPQALVQTIAQTVFDQVAAYAAKQLDKAVSKALPGTAAAAESAGAEASAAPQKSDVE